MYCKQVRGGEYGDPDVSFPPSAEQRLLTENFGDDRQ